MSGIEIDFDAFGGRGVFLADVSTGDLSKPLPEGGGARDFLAETSGSPTRQITAPEFPDKILHMTPFGELRKRVCDFSHLREKYPDMTPSEILQRYKDDPDLSDVRAFITLGLRTWNQIERAGICPLPDTVDSLYEVITTPGARTALLEVVEKRASSEIRTLAGAVVTHTDSSHLLCHPPIPIDRHGARLFVNDEARVLGPRGKAVDYLIPDAMEELGSGRIGIRVVVAVSGYSAAAHTANQVTYRGYGFEPTGVTEQIQGTFRGEPVTITCEWWVYPPFSERAKEAFAGYRSKNVERVNEIATRVAELIPDLPAHRGVVAHISRDRRDGFDLASALPGDSIFSLYSGSEVLQKAPEFRSNLYYYQQEQGPLALPPYELDAISISGGIADLIERESDLGAFLDRAAKSLNTNGGRIIIRDTEDIFRREEIEDLLTKRVGLRLLSSRLITKPDGRIQEPSTFIVAAERVPEQAGVAVQCVNRREVETPSFISRRIFRNTRNGAAFELIKRPNQTIDIAPFTDGEVYVQQGRPRPHIVNPDRGVPLDHVRSNAYSTEQLSAISPLENLDEVARSVLEDVYGFSTKTAQFSSPLLYCTLPTEIDEVVAALPVEVERQFGPVEVRKNYSGLETRGNRRSINAIRLLQACHTGAITDDRVARMIYAHHLEKGMPLGSWLGLKPEVQSQGARRVDIVSAIDALTPESGRAVFEETPEAIENRYFLIKKAEYAELTAEYKEKGRRELEYGIPSREALIKHGGKVSYVSNNAISIVPYIPTDEGILIGLGKRDSPAIQLHSERLFGYRTSQFSGTPFFSLPTDALTHDRAIRFAVERFEDIFGAKVKGATKLGGQYMATPGASLRTVHTYAFEIDQGSVKKNKLNWTAHADALAHFTDPQKSNSRRLWVDGPTLSGFFRFSHAIGAV